MGGYTRTAKWLIIRRLNTKNNHHLEIHDSIGRVKQGDGQELIQFIYNAIKPFTNQRNQYPRTMPIFFEADSEETFFQFQDFLIALHMDVSLKGYTCPIVLSPLQWKRLSKPRLPLGILVVGDTIEAINLLKNNDWFQNKTINKYGLKTTYVKNSSDTTNALKKHHQHLMVIHRDQWSVVKNHLRKIPMTHHPRVIVCLDNEAGWPDQKAGNVLEGLPCTALVWHRKHINQSAEAFIDEFVHNMIHDLAIHDAAGKNILVFANPASNQGLRISDAYEVELEKSLDNPLLTHLDTMTHEDQKNKSKDPIDPYKWNVRGFGFLDQENKSNRLLNSVVDKHQNIIDNMGLDDISFRHETTGLGPMSEFRGAVDNFKSDLDAFQDKMTRLAQPGMKELMTIERGEEISGAVRGIERQKSQNRKVNIWMQRDIRSVFDGLTPGLTGNNLFIKPGTILTNGTRYNLKLRIGAPNIFNLITTKIPGIDSALPNKKGGHNLEVVIYEQDFKLLGKRLRPLYLPPENNSKTIPFSIITPDDTGTAQLRISIYYQDYMIQSFKLTARVEEVESFNENTEHLKIELVYSRTEGFTDLNKDKKRFCAIGVNQNNNSATHTFMVKQQQVAQHVSLPEAVLSDQTGKFRETLLAALMDEFNNGTFSNANNSNAFDDVIRQLANQGSALHRALFSRHPAIAKVLKMIRSSQDKILQFVRHDIGYAFPWSIIYDFKLPPNIIGQEPQQVCRGEINGQPCNHSFKDEVFCINGFWGARHQIEQIMGYDLGIVPQLTKKDKADVLLVQGHLDDHTQQLATDLKKELGNQTVSTFPKGQNLLDRFWDQNNGPAVVVIIGHMETEEIQGEPIGPRVVIDSGKQWLMEKDVIDKVFDNEVIQNPQPLIILMSCEAAAVELKTLNDLFSSLIRAGAAGVVGTETVVFTQLAADFSQQVTLKLWQPQRYGEAIRHVRRSMLMQGNPLGFVFTAFGDADLKFS
jgi:CHAT domain